MIILNTLMIVVIVLVCIYLVANLLLSVRNMTYQRLWEKEKEMYQRSTPKISRAELCEQYVMFCMRNNCRVDF